MKPLTLPLTAAGLLLTAFNSFATDYPVTVTDMDGQKITIAKEPQHVILQDGRDIFSLALLDRENPFRRVVAWNNIPKKQDAQSWDLLRETWPESAKIMDMGFNDQGQVDLESVIAQKPDIMIAQLRAKPALEQTGVLKTLKGLNIPVVFVDYELNPVAHTTPSVTLLGKILNQEDRAKAFTDFREGRYQQIQQKIATVTIRPTVFIEPIAGNTENCCFTHAHNGWGGLVESVGARNIGSELLPGGAGFVSLEKIIAMKPDVYIMTGSKRANPNVIPFGYGVPMTDIDPVFDKLTRRTGIDHIAPVVNHRVYGIYHHFYDHPYNIIGMEILAKDIYPQVFGDLDPTADFHTIIKTFTQIPDKPVTLSK